jgi:hypothetical protein
MQMAALVAALVLGPSAASAADEVKLLRAVSYDHSTIGQEGNTWQDLYFDVKVKNLAFQKQVFVHIQDPCGGTSWVDVQGAFVQAAGPDGYELWRVTKGIGAFGGKGPFTFVVGYTVNGVTYWDNNNGNNFVVPVNQPLPSNVQGLVLGDPNVLVRAATVASGTFSGEIHLRNIAFSKAVTVVYTTDNWATQHNLSASYAAGPTGNGFEAWSFSTSVGSATSVQFAVSYTVNGQTYWDNNFNMNYTANASGANGAAAPTPTLTTRQQCS